MLATGHETKLRSLADDLTYQRLLTETNLALYPLAHQVVLLQVLEQLIALVDPQGQTNRAVFHAMQITLTTLGDLSPQLQPEFHQRQAAIQHYLQTMAKSDPSLR